VKRNETAAGYDVKDLECKVTGNNVPTPGFGLFNQVVAENGKDSDGEDNNKACGPVPVSKMRVEKSIQVNGATTGATDFIVDYKIVATNDGNTKASTGKLTDKPDFAKGLEIQSAKVAGTQAALTGAATVTPANGVYTLTNGVELDPGKTAEFWIRFQVKRNESATGTTSRTSNVSSTPTVFPPPAMASSTRSSQKAVRTTTVKTTTRPVARFPSPRFVFRRASKQMAAQTPARPSLMSITRSLLPTTET